MAAASSVWVVARRSARAPGLRGTAALGAGVPGSCAAAWGAGSLSPPADAPGSSLQATMNAANAARHASAHFITWFLPGSVTVGRNGDGRRGFGGLPADLDRHVVRAGAHGHGGGRVRRGKRHGPFALDAPPEVEVGAELCCQALLLALVHGDEAVGRYELGEMPARGRDHEERAARLEHAGDR